MLILVELFMEFNKEHFPWFHNRVIFSLQIAQYLVREPSK